MDKTKECLRNHTKAWGPYLEKYGHMLGSDKEHSIDYRNNKLYIVPIRREQAIKM